MQIFDPTCWVGDVVSPMSDQVSEVSPAREEVLQLLWNNGGQIVGYQRVADHRETGYEAARRLIKRMSEDGQVDISSSPEGSIISLTQHGRELTPHTSGNVGSNVGQDSQKVVRRLHGLTIQASVKGGCWMPEDWMATMSDHEEVDFMKSQENDYILARDKWFIRIHKDAVTFQLREGSSISGSSSREVFQELHQRVREIGSWIEKVSGQELRYKKIDINKAELGFEEHHLALLVDALPGIDLHDIRIHDDSLGKEVLHMDKSPGVPETETLSGERAEEIGQTIENELHQYVDSPEAVDWRHSFENEAIVQEVSPQEAIHGVRQIHSTADQVKEVQENIQDMKQKQEKLLKLKQEERQTRDALIELVRSNQNVIHELKEEVVQEDSGSDYDDPVQEIFMETWEDPAYNRPFFRDAADGGEHLCAFKSDGSDFEIILDSKTIQRLR